MKTWFAQQARAFHRALDRFAVAPFGTALNVGVIGAALALPLGFYILINGLQLFAARDLADSAPQLRVYMALDATRDDAAVTEGQLRQEVNVARVVFVPRDQALRELRQSSGLGDVIDSLPQNPLPDAFIVTLREPSPAALEAVREDVQRWTHVAHVQVDSAWAQRFAAMLRMARFAMGVFALGFAVLLAVVSFNTIRMQILTQRDEIEIAKLIGATNAFVRRPLRYFGVLLGLVSAATACLFVSGGVALFNQQFENGIPWSVLSVRLDYPNLHVILIVFAGATVLGWIGAELGAHRALARLESEHK